MYGYRAFSSQVKISKSPDPQTLNLNYGVIRNSLLSITITPWAHRRQSGDGSILYAVARSEQESKSSLRNFPSVCT